MRVVLVGAAIDRARVRLLLEAAGVLIREEVATLAAVQAADLEVDAIVIASERGSRDALAATNTDAFGPVAEPLTPRETQVLELLAEGLPNKAIAARLQISDQTVKFHVAAICGKLDATNRTDAVRRAVRRGLITL
jgi:DNA-binding NarL/FixJ family response regulator